MADKDQSVPVRTENDGDLVIDIQEDRSGEKALRIDESGTTTYIGYAAIGSATSAAVWQIRRLVETGGTSTLTWADGNSNFDNIWNNRASLTYS